MDKALTPDGEVRRAPAFEAWRIPPESYTDYWPCIEAQLDKIPHIWSTHWTKESLYLGGMNGNFQVWGFGPTHAINIMVFTQIAEFPAGRILEIFLAFGNSLDLALPMMDATLEKFARVSDCRAIEIIGRKGWAKKVPRFRENRVVLRWEITDQGVH